MFVHFATRYLAPPLVLCSLALIVAHRSPACLQLRHSLCDCLFYRYCYFFRIAPTVIIRKKHILLLCTLLQPHVTADLTSARCSA
ncbi:hypothetical protein OBBRIDRAFT_580688 [Obba rivulosa]|uniref:Secreted protein n=1 Tax=Obba rivulosa TaxID=1052685 RepID=A0A8E2DTN2_9APHY|nr:hypothetical protein OBBRIDRAFT_580688 [Obba rivulosa]